LVSEGGLEPLAYILGSSPQPWLSVWPAASGEARVSGPARRVKAGRSRVRVSAAAGVGRPACPGWMTQRWRRPGRSPRSSTVILIAQVTGRAVRRG